MSKGGRAAVVAALGIALMVGGAAAIQELGTRLFSGATGADASVAAQGQDPVRVGGPFHLVDQSGASRSDSDFRGRVMIIVFGFTRCPDVCPLQLQTVADAMDRLGADAAKIVPLFITIDPHFDTPQRLASFVAQFHPAILGLTGGDEAVAAATHAFHVHVMAAHGANPHGIEHSSFYYVMGQDGALRSLLPPGTTAEEMVAALRRYVGS